MKSDQDSLENRSTVAQRLIAPLMDDPQAEVHWDRLLSAILDEEISSEAICALTPTVYRLGAGSNRFVWQRTAIMAAVQLVRCECAEPALSGAFLLELAGAIDQFAAELLAEFRSFDQPMHLRSALGFLAAWKGQAVYATALLEYSEDELREYFLP